MDDQPETLADIWRHLRERLGEPVERDLRRRLLSLSIRTAAADKPTVALVTDMGGHGAMTMGLWLPELIELCGGIMLGAAKGAGPVPLSPVLRAAADVVVVALPLPGLARSIGVGLSIGRLREDQRMVALSGLETLHGGPAAIATCAEVLAEVLHGDPKLSFGHQGRLWKLL
jgi:hypothetical protein